MAGSAKRSAAILLVLGATWLAWDGAQPASASPAAGVWLGVAAPDDGVRIPGPVPFVEVWGRAGAATGGRQDVVIVVDVSGSTLIASGADVDRDGKVGYTSSFMQRALLGLPGGRRRISPYRICSDFGDTIRAAEVAAARRLLELLHPELTRVGLVSFHAVAKLEAPLGSSRAELSRALDGVDLDPSAWGGGTNFRAALARALKAFRDAPPAGEGTLRSVLFLSDGQPTLPGNGTRPEKKALEEAGRAARAGVRIHTFALGPEVIEHLGIYADIAELSGGRMTKLPDPSAILTELPRTKLADVAQVSIENLTGGEPGRAVRLFPDGSFDGLLPLRPGPNRVRVTARALSGQRVVDLRTVHYEPREPSTPEEQAAQRQQLEAFRLRLEARTAETEALRAIERARAAQRKELEVRAEPTAPVSSGP